MGLGFTLSLTILGALREILGAGTFFGLTVYTEELMPPVSIMVLAPGAFFVLAMVIAVRNKIIRGRKTAAEAGCDKIDCGHCGNTACAGHKTGSAE